MAAYAGVRHIELDKVGCGKKRITKPPGGESSDIFGASPTSTPPSTPRKMKNYVASTIFNPEDGQPGKAKQRPADNDSFKRLFGANKEQPQTGGDLTDGQMTPRGKNHQKSSIIFNDAAKAESPVIVANGDSNGHVSEVVVVTNGFTNGINGHTNGHSPNNVHYNAGGGSTGSISGPSSGPSSGSSTPNGSINGDYKTNGYNGAMPTTPSRRIPPGGYSSKLW